VSSTVGAELAEQIKTYFGRAIGTVLLYPQEAAQHADVVIAGTEDMCAVYGAEHLLRLFTKFPSFLAKTDMPPKHTEVTVKCLGEVLKYMQSHAAELFKQ
jgi:mortality factor 4-like protein 1